jgi:hypothetical protein
LGFNTITCLSEEGEANLSVLPEYEGLLRKVMHTATLSSGPSYHGGRWPRGAHWVVSTSFTHSTDKCSMSTCGAPGADDSGEVRVTRTETADLPNCTVERRGRLNCVGIFFPDYKIVL